MPRRARKQREQQSDAELLRRSQQRRHIALLQGRDQERDAENEGADRNETANAFGHGVARRCATASAASRSSGVSTSHHDASPISTPRTRPRRARSEMPALSVVSPPAHEESSAPKSGGSHTNTPVSSASNGSSILPISVTVSPHSR